MTQKAIFMQTLKGQFSCFTFEVERSWEVETNYTISRYSERATKIYSEANFLFRLLHSEKRPYSLVVKKHISTWKRG